MNFKAWGKKLLSSMVSIINATGASNILERFWRMFAKCHEKKSGPECNKTIGMGMMSSSLALAWIDHLIKWIPSVPSLRNSRTPTRWNIATDISVMWNFYLQALLTLYTQAYGKDKETDDRWETPLILGGTFILAVLSNARIRNFSSHLRNNKKVNGTVGFFRGFANGRMFVETIEKIITAYSSSEAIYTPLGTFARFTFGGLCGIATTYISVKYSPQIETENLFPEPYRNKIETTILVANGIFSAFTFGSLVGANIKKSGDNNIIIGFSIGHLSLIPAEIIRLCCSNGNNNLVISPLSKSESPAHKEYSFHTPNEHLSALTSTQPSDEHFLPNATLPTTLIEESLSSTQERAILSAEPLSPSTRERPISNESLLPSTRAAIPANELLLSRPLQITPITSSHNYTLWRSPSSAPPFKSSSDINPKKIKRLNQSR